MPQPRSQPPHTEAVRERALEGLFLGSPLPMLLVEVRSRRITRANGALGELLGCTPEDLNGHPLRDLDDVVGRVMARALRLLGIPPDEPVTTLARNS